MIHKKFREGWNHLGFPWDTNRDNNGRNIIYEGELKAQHQSLALLSYQLTLERTVYLRESILEYRLVLGLGTVKGNSDQKERGTTWESYGNTGQGNWKRAWHFGEPSWLDSDTRSIAVRLSWSDPWTLFWNVGTSFRRESCSGPEYSEVEQFLNARQWSPWRFSSVLHSEWTGVQGMRYEWFENMLQRI